MFILRSLVHSRLNSRGSRNDDGAQRHTLADSEYKDLEALDRAVFNTAY